MRRTGRSRSGRGRHRSRYVGASMSAPPGQRRQEQRQPSEPNGGIRSPSSVRTPRPFAHVAASLVAVLALAACSSSHTDTSTVRGQVWLDGGAVGVDTPPSDIHAVSHGIVILTPARHPGHAYSARTDRRGRFAIRLPDGTYRTRGGVSGSAGLTCRGPTVHLAGSETVRASLFCHAL